jgi:pyruvate-ferredoxin/flavodoxin oxidoreductase
MPPDAVTVRFHSVGGWGAITTGKNLAMTLFELLGYHIKANPKYGSEKKGQPTTYYLSAAPEPIRINCEYFFVDAVLSPDPNVFSHTNALAGLKEGGTFIIQSDLESAAGSVGDHSRHYQRSDRSIRDQGLLPRCLQDRPRGGDRSGTAAPHAGHRLPGRFFAASPVDGERRPQTRPKLLEAIREQLQHKFGAKGARVVEDNVRVVRRGYDELARSRVSAPGQRVRVRTCKAGAALPPMLRMELPQSQARCPTCTVSGSRQATSMPGAWATTTWRIRSSPPAPCRPRRPCSAT